MGPRTLACGTRRLPLATPQIMGVLNVTPDSFSDGGRWLSAGKPDLGRIRDAAQAMIEAGAALIDVGGESSRPGAQAVDVREELARVMPVVETLVELNTIVSVDTCKADVARAALGAGCQFINDITGLRDPRLLEVVAGSNAAVCVMHMQGEPRTMQQDPRYDDVVGEVAGFLAEQVQVARRAGIRDERLCVDPGFGFGKSLGHNLALLRQLPDLAVDGLPLLVGLSRKRMIGALTGSPSERRLIGSVTAAVLAAERGADIVRVHDVAETATALKVLEAVRQ